jgi:hypothetical protein
MTELVLLARFGCSRWPDSWMLRHYIAGLVKDVSTYIFALITALALPTLYLMLASVSFRRRLNRSEEPYCVVDRDRDDRNGAI